MKITITINTANAAFEDDPGEVARILRFVALATQDHRTAGSCDFPLLDINGNTVGRVEVVSDDV